MPTISAWNGAAPRCRRRRLAAALALLLALWLAGTALAQDNGAATLRAKHAALQESLQRNAFGRPLVLESQQSSGDLRGDVYAVVEHPFAVVSRSLQGIERWCDVLILHLNVKYCRALGAPATDILSASIGRKFDQPLSEAFRVDFQYRSVAASDDHMQVQLSAEQGPFGTHNYRIVLEAVPLDGGRSFVHLSYAYGYGLAARLAMQGYLATLGAGKVGFTVVERKPDGQPVYVGGVRGAVERNTMRYYLAIEAYLGALAAPPAEQQEKRLRDWFAATERHAQQLREIDAGEYMEMKRREVQRQRSEVRSTPAR